MDEQAVARPLLKADLARGLKERLALYIAGRTADLGDDDVRTGVLADLVDEVLYLAGDVGDDLNGLAEVLAAALTVEDIPVDLAGGKVRVAVEILIDEALIVPEVEIGLSAVLGDIDLAVLVGAHRAGVDVYIRVELLRCNLEAACLEQTAERGRGDTLAKTGHNAAGNENILSHNDHPPQ